MFIGLFCILVRLGFWQLSRGHERQQLEQAYYTRQQQTVGFNQLIQNKDPKTLTGSKTKVQLNITQTPLIFLDNQSVKGKVGYLVYQLMQVSPKQPWLLVELGFITAYADRNRLPKIQKINKQEVFLGRVYHTSKNPFSHKLLPEKGNPLRIQNLNYQQLSQLLGHQVFDFALQPQRVIYSADGRQLLKPWRPITMSSTKNFGYAAQWFAMATVLVVIGLFTVIRRRKVGISKKK
ncbi:SURF1 family protein [Shewanella sp. 202IG2-18]|uniref:SURF1 family protein n=1 Tax=Parashewanella hymeniacidonis TaxID=2807618 RepID=UPI001961FAC3|nr:SURF1 family protein [Parashewanella hymeniacidonis]MBM7070441.1 SURF1 family protein [Parashewanella hymeniacidonis]